MLIHLCAIAAGFVALIWAADRFVLGAAAVARRLGASPLLIGLTIVALGTSAPEIFVSISAAWSGNPGIAIGNALGSNITNIALVLGLVALLKPILAHSRILRRELPIVLGISIMAYALCADGSLDRVDGYILMGGTFALMLWLAKQARSNQADTLAIDLEAETPPDLPIGMATFWLFIGLIMLPVSSQTLIYGAVGIATSLGISDLIIGLTIVAIGTSLPELAASLAGVFKNEPDIAIGNVLGSNMFNLLVVLGIPGLLSPGLVPEGLLGRDFPVMIGLTIALFIMCISRSGQAQINRFEGGLLLATFIAYEAMLYYTSVS